MIVDVSRKHIEKGKCRIPQHCMIAEAIRDVMPNVGYVGVRANRITTTERRRDGSRVRKHWFVPLKAARAIVRFDNEGEVKPFRFETKATDRKVFPPRTDEQKGLARSSQRAKRAKMRADGKVEKYGRQLRVAGI